MILIPKHNKQKLTLIITLRIQSPTEALTCHFRKKLYGFAQRREVPSHNTICYCSGLQMYYTAHYIWCRYLVCIHVTVFYDRMTVYRNRFLVNKTNRGTEFQFYWYYDSTCFGQPFCPSSGVLSSTSALVHFMM